MYPWASRYHSKITHHVVLKVHHDCLKFSDFIIIFYHISLCTSLHSTCNDASCCSNTSSCLKKSEKLIRYYVTISLSFYNNASCCSNTSSCLKKLENLYIISTMTYHVVLIRHHV